MLFTSSDDDDGLPDIPLTEGVPRTAAEAHEHHLQMMEAELREGEEEDEATRSDSAERRLSTGADCGLSYGDTVDLELRRLVPYLSADFRCDTTDALRLLTAIRSGAVGSTGGESLQDRVAALEAERRSLEQRLQRARREQETLSAELREARQLLTAARQEGRDGVERVATRREEMRRLLLIEQTRTEKYQVRNRILEKELEDLRERFRGRPQ